MKADGLRRIFKLKNEKIENEFAGKELDTEEIIDARATSGDLCKQLADIPPTYSGESVEESLRWPYIIKGTEEDMIPLMQLLSNVIRRLTKGNRNISNQTNRTRNNDNEMEVDQINEEGDNDDDEENESISNLANSEMPLVDFLRKALIPVHPNIARILQSLKLSLKYLKQLSTFVHRLFFDKGYLFADLGDSLNAEKLHESTQQNFVKLTSANANQATQIRNLRSSGKPVNQY